MLKFSPEKKKKRDNFIVMHIFLPFFNQPPKTYLD